MQKISIHAPGGYDKLSLETCPDLSLAGEPDDAVVVDVEASGVNYADCCVRWGVYESAKQYVGWPITPGFEFAGRVRDRGPAATRFAVGDRVMGVTRFGAYATQVRVPAKHLYALPQGFDAQQAAGFPAVFMTAYHALFQLVRLPDDATILVHSAGGGVGSALVQLARAAGFRAVGVVGAAHKVAYVEALGAHAVVDKSAFASKRSLWEAIGALCPRGYDAVLDANGPATLRESYAALRPTGKLVAYGAHGMLPRGGASGRLDYLKAAWGLVTMPRFDPMRLVGDNKSVVGFNLSFLFERDDLIGEGMERLLALVRDGKLAAPAVRAFPLERAAEAHACIESGRTTGKLVLVTGAAA